MATPHRRSARIASASLNRDTASPAPRLGSVLESEEPTLPETIIRPSLDAIMSSPGPREPITPSAALPVKVPATEMHPSRYQITTAAPSSALKHGFVDIGESEGVADSHTTPSKTRVPSSEFTFRATRPTYDGQLGPDARRMMDELREEAAQIKKRLKAEKEVERARGNDSRVIAKAKGKAGRFSDVHMAEFKKMDSIENHPSAFRADPSRVTPIKPAVKRSQAAANLDEPESAKSKFSQSQTRSIRKVPSKNLDVPSSPIPTKRIRQRVEDDTSSARPLSRDGGSSIPRPKSSGLDSPRGAVSRSKIGSNLMTPTKSATARLQASKVPTIQLVKSPSKTELNSVKDTAPKMTGPTLNRSTSKASLASLTKTPSKPETGSLSLVRTPSKTGGISGLIKSSSKSALPFAKSATMSRLPAPANAPTHIQTPGRFDKIKSILKRHVSGSSKPPKTGTTYSATSPSKIHGRQHFVDRPLAPVPMSTPAKLAASVTAERHVNFTPDTKGAASEQNSPSPVKSSLPRSVALAQPPTKQASPVKVEGRRLFGPKKQKEDGEVSYPDLSAYDAPKEEAPEPTETATPKRQILSPLPPSVPGTFTFRSDHTIQFDTPPVEGFGGSMGQSSVRHIRESSVMPTAHMPGAFPRTFGASTTINKENANPDVQKTPVAGMQKTRVAVVDVPAVPHGLANKKRHRAGSEEGEDIDEGAQRGAKKLRKTPGPKTSVVDFSVRAVGSPSPVKSVKKPAVTPGSMQKKKSGMSLSRLNMLAQPKLRR